jgi:hypothetical protein
MQQSKESKRLGTQCATQARSGRATGVHGCLRPVAKLPSRLRMLCAVAVLNLASSAAANEATCKPFVDASAKTSHTPSHSHSVQTIEGATKAMAMLGMDKPTVVEQYNTGTKTYLFTPKDGQWTSMPSDEISNAVSSSEAKLQLQKTECSVLRTESMNGDLTTVFQSSSVDPVNRTTTWISQTSGLILRMDVDVEVNGTTKSHSSAIYDYKNIELPAGAR